MLFYILIRIVELNYKNNLSFYQKGFRSRGSVDCKSNSKWNGNAKIEVRLFGSLNDLKDIDTGYNVEMAISWEELDIKPHSGTKPEIDFGNGDSEIFFD